MEKHLEQMSFTLSMKQFELIVELLNDYPMARKEIDDLRDSIYSQYENLRDENPSGFPE